MFACKLWAGEHLCHKGYSLAWLHSLYAFLDDVVAMLAGHTGQHIALQLLSQAQLLTLLKHLYRPQARVSKYPMDAIDCRKVITGRLTFELSSMPGLDRCLTVAAARCCQDVLKDTPPGLSAQCGSQRC